MGAEIQVELVSADISGALRSIADMGITLMGVEPQSELRVTFRIRRGSYRTLRSICERKNWSIRVIKRGGVYWSLKCLLYRPILTGGLALILLASVILQGRILTVEIQGNETVPSRQILEAAAKSGIGFFAPARAVRSEKMKNNLLGELPQLRWAGVNTYGSRAVITVKEQQSAQQDEEKAQVSSIVAARDGVITSAVVTSGSAQCVPGQAVLEGDVLISGFTDCGLTIEATRASGEIYALTKRKLTVKTPQIQAKRDEQKGNYKKYSLIIGKKRINFYKGSGICDTSCDKMYTRYVLTLPGGFELPVSLIRENVREYETVEAIQDETQTELQLRQFAKSYLQRLMVSGIVLNAAEFFQTEDGFCLIGSYECQEMIGREIPEGIGVYNGKTD